MRVQVCVFLTLLWFNSGNIRYSTYAKQLFAQDDFIYIYPTHPNQVKNHAFAK